MKDYITNKIRNVVLAGHGSAGKTSLMESMLFQTKAIERLGKVDEGNSVGDYDPEEIKRRASLQTTMAPVEYRNHKLNIIDTPGFFDFIGGFYEGLFAGDSVLISVSGKSGVAVGTKKAYKKAVELQKARMFFVGKLDRESADFYKVLEELKANFGPSICPIVVPFYIDSKVDCYIDLIHQKAYKYDEKGNATEVDMPDTQHRLEGLLAAISEAVAETDEALFEKYFSGEQFTKEELLKGIRQGVKGGEITPVVCGSAQMMAGIDLLMDMMIELLPDPAEKPVEAQSESGELVEIQCDSGAPLIAYVFKTVADPYVGKMSYIKVLSGKLSSENTPVNMTSNEPEKIGKLLFVCGKKQIETKSILAGDIGVATKLSANTGDTLCVTSKKVIIKPIEFPHSCYSMAVVAKEKGDEGKISQAIQRLLEEDRTLSFEINKETKQQLLGGLGEQHLDVAVSKMKSRFGVDVNLVEPIIPYRETIRKKVKVEGKHKKQTGGHGQFGHVWIEFEPCESEGLVFEEKIFGGAVPKGYFPAVEKGLLDSMQKGVLSGYPMVNVKATLLDGSYHPVDSSEMAFKMAASLAYRNGIPQASPVLLEPIGHLKVEVPDNNTGDMMGELNKLRGRVLGMEPSEEGMTVIDAQVPMSEMHDFATLVRQMTQGAGSFTMEFEGYEEVPMNIADEVISKAKKSVE